ncbi:hypothetical protein [Pannonibacter indicus]|uniref:hypothetical protein n=1 Tax=Pannonibacter indicus TaxID=466044 RepID=UPI00391BEDAE
MLIYHFHPATAQYLGFSEADESPLEPGVYLIPAHATDVPPPEPADGFIRKFVDGGWLLEAVPEPEPQPEPEPETPAPLPPLTVRQFRLGLLDAGMTPAHVDDVIAQIEDEASRIRAQIEWEYASQFQRTHPLVATLSAALGLTPEQVDSMWAAAAQL